MDKLTPCTSIKRLSYLRILWPVIVWQMTVGLYDLWTIKQRTGPKRTISLGRSMDLNFKELINKIAVPYI